MRWMLLLPALLIVGCQANRTSQTDPTRGPLAKLVVDPWKLETNDPSSTEPAWLSNGLVGIRLSRASIGYDPDGNSLPFFLADEYDADGEEKIRPLLNPISVEIDEASNEFVTTTFAQDAKDYRQELDLRTAVLKTSWTASLNKGSAAVSSETVLHPSERILAQRWTIVPTYDADVSAAPASIGSLNPIPQDARSTGTEKDQTYRMDQLGAAKVKWECRWRQLTPAKPNYQPTKKGKPYIVEMTWSFGRSHQYIEIMAKRGIALKVAPSFFDPIPSPTFDAVLEASTAAWAKRWNTDIEIDGPVEDQQAVRSFLFYLQCAMNPEAPVGPAPMGLSSAQYNGHVFWDADIWMFPALVLMNPALARAIPQYRMGMRTQASNNFNTWLRAGRPTATGKVSGPAPSTGITTSWYADPVLFPWESSVSGKETVPGSSKWESHITGSVAFGLDQAAALGLAESTQADLIIQGAGSYYDARSEPVAQGREIKGVMSPDENHVGDNDLYTNLLAEWLVRDHGVGVPPAKPGKGSISMKKETYTGIHAGGTPAPQRQPFKRPRDAKSLLTYDNDALRGYKQAAAALAIYPLQDPEAEKQAKVMMDRFADKVSPNGPAMTDSVHSVIWSRIGMSDKAYEAWHKSWRDFTKHPLLLFSEKRRKPVTYFVTGAGGSLQSVIYGFLGFRIDSRPEPSAAWSKKLLGERWLSVKPHLPKAWKSVKFKNFRVLGRTYTLVATHNAAKVTQGE